MKAGDELGEVFQFMLRKKGELRKHFSGAEQAAEKGRLLSEVSGKTSLGA
jgi:hypothetical protein